MSTMAGRGRGFIVVGLILLAMGVLARMLHFMTYERGFEFELIDFFIILTGIVIPGCLVGIGLGRRGRPATARG